MDHLLRKCMLPGFGNGVNVSQMSTGVSLFNSTTVNPFKNVSFIYCTN